MNNSNHGFQPTAEDLALLRDLDLSPSLGDYPKTVLRIARLIHDLQEKSSGQAGVKKFGKQLRSALESP